MTRHAAISLALWIALSLVLVAIGFVVLRGCGIGIPGLGFLDRCPEAGATEIGFPADLEAAQRETGVLRDRLGDLHVELAYAPDCQPEPVTLPPGFRPYIPGSPSLPVDPAPDDAAGEEPAPVMEPEAAPAVEDPPEVPPEPEPRPDAARIEDEAAFDDRVAEAGGDSSDYQITLIWDTQHDLDLMVLCPDGSRIVADSPRSCGGQLDVDANGQGINGGLRDRPVENITWDGPPPPGRYLIGVRTFGNHLGDTGTHPDNQPVPFQIRVRAGERRFEVSGVSIAPDDVHVTEFTIP